MSDTTPLVPDSVRLLNVRAFAALDIALHGRIFILGEFVLSVLVSGALGAFILYKELFASSRTFSFGATLLGFALLWIALNYIPLAIHAIGLVRAGAARESAEARARLKSDQGRYGPQGALLLLLPFGMLVLAIVQEARQRNPHR
jgi:hypothetical protein